MGEDDLAGHDQLWQELLEKFLRDFLELTVPEIAAELRLERKPVFLRQKTWGPPVSPVSLRGQLRICDLVAELVARRPPPRSLIVNVEVEYAFRLKTALRLRSYRRHLALHHRGTPILSIVLYLHGGTGGVVKSELWEAPWGIELSVFFYYAFGLAKSRAEEWLGRPQPLTAALAALMDRGDWSRAEHKLHCLQAVARAKVDAQGRFLLVNAVETYLQLTPEEGEQFRELLARREHTEVRVMAQTWAAKIREEGVNEGKRRGHEQGLEEGRELGLEQGRELGLEQGARRLLMRQLQLRFGPLPAVTLDRLAAIHDLTEFDRLAERLLRAKSLAELGLA